MNHVDVTASDGPSGKRRKVVAVSNYLIACSKGRIPTQCTFTCKEYVLIMPPCLTKSAYQTLIACNVVPRQWHLEGRFGSRTHNVDKSTNGVPILYDQNALEEISQQSPELKQLLEIKGVIVVEKDFVQNHRTKQSIPEIDARIHPEREPNGYVPSHISPKCLDTTTSQKAAAFTYAELFGGIGGFGVALEQLGGKCVFYSEIDEVCRETYSKNFDTPTSCIHGDIYEVLDDDFPNNLDVLVAGFPCQPFSTLGDQAGFDCKKGRGYLYLQIIRVLKISQPRCFLFENVPGLLRMKDTLNIIVNAFKDAGYYVTAEVCSARGLTATCRKRLFFVGIRKDLTTDCTKSEQIPPKETTTSPFDSNFFDFPYIPDLKLCAHDILDYDSLPLSELEILRLSESTFNQLQQNKKWKSAHLAWPNRHCDTLTSHYGNAVGRGDSQLVPSSAPHLPRRFSVRETARIMGFPNSYKFCDGRKGQGKMAHIKVGYRMVGNSVCVPLIAALVGSVLDAAGFEVDEKNTSNDTTNWTAKGLQVAVDLACASLRSSPVNISAGCLISST